MTILPIRGKLTIRNLRKSGDAQLKQISKPSVVPIYGIGITWLVFAVFLGLHKPAQYVACAAVSAGVYLLLKKKFPGTTESVEEPETPPDTGNEELDAMLLQGRRQLEQIRQLNAQIPDEAVSEKLERIESLAGKILDQTQKDTAMIKQTRQFLNYYLPTTVKLLQQYVELQKQGVSGGNIEAGMAKIEGLLDTVAVAFQKQLDSLFASQVVDIAADIQVMENMMSSQGLTNEKDF